MHDAQHSCHVWTHQEVADCQEPSREEGATPTPGRRVGQARAPAQRGTRCARGAGLHRPSLGLGLGLRVDLTTTRLGSGDHCAHNTSRHLPPACYPTRTELTPLHTPTGCRPLHKVPPRRPNLGPAQHPSYQLLTSDSEPASATTRQPGLHPPRVGPQ
jgi:hypothetical protein